MLIAGGATPTGGSLASTELYDPATNSFATSGTANMRSGPPVSDRDAAAQRQGPDRRGAGRPGREQPGPMIPQPTASPPPPPTLTNFRFSPAAALLPNGRVLIAGGADLSDTPLSSTDLYNPTTDTITAGPIMNQQRSRRSPRRVAQRQGSDCRG